jgi:CubicO group peptidase (beta-lactamase class C family)
LQFAGSHMFKPRLFIASAILGTLAALAACEQQSSSSAQPVRPVAAIASPAFAQACSAEDAAAVYPAEHWAPVNPASAGWSDEGVERLLNAAELGHWVSGMVVHGGRVVARFGDTSVEYDSRSIRKAFMGAVIGQLVDEGALSLDATLADMNIDDAPRLTPVERGATLRHMLQSRTGIYREAAFMTPGDREGMPAPGTHAPGQEYWYNNWTFNALGTVVRNTTGEDLGAVIDARIARPLGMEDFGPEDVRERFEDVSQHSAYRTWMSTRDRARFGLMFLRHGCWDGRQIVPAQFVADSLNPSTLRDGSDDFGYLWRSQEPIARLGMTERFYYARGNALQYVMLIPEWDIVLVLTTDMDRPGWQNWVRRRVGMEPDLEDVSSVLTALHDARPR